MDGEVAEHEAFSAGLEEFHTYLLQCQKSPAAFSAEKLIAIMDSFGPVLHEHLSHEPPNLVALRKYDFDIATMNNQHGEEEMKSTHPVHRLPFLWVNWDDDFEDGMWKDFIQMPVIVRFIFSRVLSLWHRRMWRFGSCTYTGQRKELLYGKPVEEMKVQ